MNKFAIAVVVTLSTLSMVGCANMSPTQKKWATVGASVLVVGAIAAHQADHGNGNATPTASAATAQCEGMGCRPVM